MKSINYEVIFEKFTERHFIKSFVEQKDIKICKTEFKIAGTNESRHGSGNRCIIAVNKKLNQVKVLLIYHKNDLGGHNETSEWKGVVRENYGELKELLG